MTHHMNAVSLAEHQRVLSMASEFADRAEQAESAIARVRGKMKARALTAEAAIARVREVCDQRDAEVADMDAFYRQVVLVSVDEVRRALDWGDE